MLAPQFSIYVCALCACVCVLCKLQFSISVAGHPSPAGQHHTTRGTNVAGIASLMVADRENSGKRSCTVFGGIFFTCRQKKNPRIIIFQRGTVGI